MFLTAVCYSLVLFQQFLQLFTDKSQTGSGSYEYPFTPAPGEFEQIERKRTKTTAYCYIQSLLMLIVNLF